MSVNEMELKEPDPIAAEAYVDSGGGVVPIPPKGTYTLETVASEWGATKDGYLQATLTHKVVAPGQPYHGHEVRYHRVNVKKWPNREGNGMADYLRAQGIADIPTSNAGYRQYVDACVGRQFQAGLDWEVFNSAKGLDIKGQEKFPNGGTQDWVPDPADGTKKLYARATVKFTVSKVPKG